MKKVLFLFLLFFVLCACSNEPRPDYSEPKNQQTNNRFQATGTYYYVASDRFEVIKDTQTRNLYLYNSSLTYGAHYVPCLVPLYDEKGNIAKADK